MTPNTAFKVKIHSTGQVIEVAQDCTVVEALSFEGITILTACAQGICGTCLTGLVEGIADHRDQYLTAQEQAANDQFTPCCSRAKTPMLVLDL